MGHAGMACVNLTTMGKLDETIPKEIDCKCPSLVVQVIGGERSDHRLLPVPHSKKSTDQAVSLSAPGIQRSMLLLLHSNKCCVAIVGLE